MQKNMQESLRLVKENAEKESKDLRQQLHIRDMEKVRDRLLSEAGDIIVELIPPITPETTEKSLLDAIEHARNVSDSYRQRFGASQVEEPATKSINQNNILPNNKGGRNAMEARELDGLLKDLEKVTDVKELERRLGRIQQLNGSVL